MPSEAEEDAEREIEAQRAERGVGERFEGEVGGDAEEDPRDADRGGRRAERGDGDAGVEAAHQFFEHEHGAGDRGVERGGEAGAGAGGEQDAGVGGVAAEEAADEMGDARAHLHRRSFAAEREAGADGQEATDEFHGEQQRVGGRSSCMEDGFDVRDAAAGGFGREAADEPGGERGGGGGERDDEREAEETVAVGPGDECVAPAVGVHEREAEHGTDESGRRTGQQREQREREPGCCVRGAELAERSCMA